MLRYRQAVLRYLDRVQALIARNPPDLEARLSRLARQVAKAALPAGRDAQRHARNELERLLGVRPKMVRTGDQAVIQAFYDEQVRLFEKLGRDIQARMAAGAPVDAMKLADWRAKLIAADQSHKVFAEALAYYGVQVGSPGYRWRCSLDDRVRPGHRALHGTAQAWNIPPFTGPREGFNHPGQAIACRCSADILVPRSR